MRTSNAWLALLTAAGLSLSLPACGGSSEEEAFALPEAPAAPAPAQQVEAPVAAAVEPAPPPPAAPVEATPPPAAQASEPPASDPSPRSEPAATPETTTEPATGLASAAMPAPETPGGPESPKPPAARPEDSAEAAPPKEESQAPAPNPGEAPASPPAQPPPAPPGEAPKADAPTTPPPANPGEAPKPDAPAPAPAVPGEPPAGETPPPPAEGQVNPEAPPLPEGADKPADFRTAFLGVNSFLVALQIKDPERLAEATALRAEYEATERHKRMFKAILQKSLPDNELNELAKSFEGYRIVSYNNVKTTGRMGIILEKSEGKDTLRRTLQVRREKLGWKVVDIGPSMTITGIGGARKKR